MGNNESAFDILMEKATALRQEQLEKARSDPQLAHELYVTGLYPEVEEFYYPCEPLVLKISSRN